MLRPLLWLLLAGRAAAGAVLSVELRGEPAREVSPAFLSITIDANLARDPRFIFLLGSPKLRTLARGLSPGFLRFGGTRTDFLIFNPEKDSTLEERDLWELQANRDICGVRSIPTSVEELLLSQWPIQEKALLQEQAWKEYKNTTITKPNSFRKKSGIYIDGFQLGQDFIHLYRLLRNYSSYRNSKLYGPDAGQPRKNTQKLLRSFLKSGGKVIDSVTWHHYYVNGRVATREDFLSPEVLETFITAVKDVLQIVDETVPGKKVWLGETSSAYGGGAPRLSNTYVAGFMWLDKLGLSARLGIDVVMRQVFYGGGTYHLVDANFEPLPDYWLSLLYKKLVGTKVLKVGLKGADPKKLRVYLHCTNNLNPTYKEGDVTLFLLNLYNTTKHVQLPHNLSDKHIDEYLLLPHGKEDILSRSVQLNGHVLRMVDNKTLPALKKNRLRPGSALGLPAFSYGFYVIRNAKATACI
ncbi:heparanase isoform X2 [Carettochelys insculpta]|uniref:heparanase isoform X2 n=1 Tax=Carettochelys insculpta TaxID=44489 RepID=UPI003EBE7A19